MDIDLSVRAWRSPDRYPLAKRRLNARSAVLSRKLSPRLVAFVGAVGAALWWSAMSMIFSTTPTAEQLRTLDTAQLALIVLKSLGDQTNIQNLLRRGAQLPSKSQNGEPDADTLLQRVSDAWAWLVANGLVQPRRTNMSSDWYRVTERGAQVTASDSVRQLFGGAAIAERPT